MRGVEEISCPPKCSDSVGAGSGPVLLVFLHLRSRSQSHCRFMGTMGACSGSWGGVRDTPCFRASPPVAGAALIAACRATTPEPSLPVRLPWQPAWDRATVRAQASPPGLQSYSSFTVTTNLPVHLFFHFTVSETNNGLSFALPPTALPLLSASIP